MPTRNEGFAFHVHHDALAEYCTNYQERVDYIKTNKPAGELRLRLRLFKLIPVNKLPYTIVEARRTCDEAWKARDEAGKACDEAWKAREEAGKACDEAGKARGEARRTCDGAWKARDEAGKARDEAGKAYDEAWKAYAGAGRTYMSDLIKIHAQLCKRCPWDGTTIFPANGGKHE